MTHVATKLPLLLCILVMACGERKIPFTQDLRMSLRLTDEELTGLQYYLADELLLRRKERNGEREVSSDHRLIVTSGTLIEEVAAAAGTLGVATSAPNSQTLEAIFKKEGKSLRFINYGDRQITQGAGVSVKGQYCLAGKREVRYDGEAFLTFYDGKEFEVIKTPCLQIGKEQLSSLVKKREVLPGLKLPRSK